MMSTQSTDPRTAGGAHLFLAECRSLLVATREKYAEDAEFCFAIAKGRSERTTEHEIRSTCSDTALKKRHGHVMSPLDQCDAICGVSV